MNDAAGGAQIEWMCVCKCVCVCGGHTRIHTCVLVRVCVCVCVCVYVCMCLYCSRSEEWGNVAGRLEALWRASFFLSFFFPLSPAPLSSPLSRFLFLSYSLSLPFFTYVCRLPCGLIALRLV